jgi:hypothetical protein
MKTNLQLDKRKKTNNENILTKILMRMNFNKQIRIQVYF